MPRIASASAPAVAIFKAGTHRDMHGRDISFSARDLAQIASGYDPAHPAPLVVGHPKDTDPAYGWASSLTVGDDGMLYAALDQVDEQLAGDVRAGRFRNVSASLWQPDHPSNPKPGQWYLRHIGLLGASAPAIPGLPPINLSADPQVPCFEFAAERSWAWREVIGVFRRLRDWMVEQVGVEKADQVVPAWQIDSIAEATTPAAEPAAALPSLAYAASLASPAQEPSMSTDPKAADFAARESALSAREQSLQEREQSIAAREQADREAAAKLARTEALAFAAGLADAGRILPRHQAPLVEVLLALPQTPVSFAGEAGEQQAEPAALLRDFLQALPAQIHYGERSRAAAPAPAPAFSAPPGSVVDGERMALLHKARAHIAAHPTVSFVDAVKAVGG